jgi:pimeloyl-ACP methyl ester carboxylesterase
LGKEWNMPAQVINGIPIAYETFGPADGRPLVMIQGLATSMTAWPAEFTGMLTAAGHRVVCFDNRDTGWSGKIEAAGIPDLEALMKNEARPPYTLSDMAADTLGLMDFLGIERARVCGVSMGGMIAQTMAVEHPDRVAGLVLMMSTTGEPELPASSDRVRQAMMSMPPGTRAEYQDYLVELMRVFAGDSDQYDAQVQHRQAGIAFDHGLYPAGLFRQLAAIIASAGRRERLRQVRVPTLVIHGDHDTVLPLAHGRDLSAAIPGARLLVVPGLGHGLAFPRLWPQIAEAICGQAPQLKPE